MGSRVITMAQDESPEFATVQEEINAVPLGNKCRTIIQLVPGGDSVDVEQYRHPNRRPPGAPHEALTFAHSYLGVKDLLSVQRKAPKTYLPEYLTSKDVQTLEEANYVLMKAGVADDEMEALERQLVHAANNATTKDIARHLGFVSVGVQNDGGEVIANSEETGAARGK